MRKLTAIIIGIAITIGASTASAQTHTVANEILHMFYSMDASIVGDTAPCPTTQAEEAGGYCLYLHTALPAAFMASVFAIEESDIIRQEGKWDIGSTANGTAVFVELRDHRRRPFAFGLITTDEEFVTTFVVVALD